METNGVKIMRRRKSSGRNRGKKRRIKKYGVSRGGYRL